MPGQYTAVLTVDGQKYTQPLTVQMDPRVKATESDLQKQFDLSHQLYQDLMSLQPVVERASAARKQLQAMSGKVTGADAGKVAEALKALDAIEGAEGRRRRGRHAETLTGTRDSLLQMLTMLQEVDAAPTTQAALEVPKLSKSTAALLEQWHEFEAKELAPLKVRP